MFNQNKVQELYPGAKMYEPMKIHASTETSLKAACESGNYFGQLKKDGYWYQYENHKEGCYLFSRSASKKTGLLAEKGANVPHIMNILNTLPPDTILVGEIYYPGKKSKDVTSIMGCLPEKAIDRQKGNYGLIHYYIHDIIMYDGVNLIEERVQNELRYKILEAIFKKHNLYQYDFLELASIWYDDLYSLVGDALADGEEGMVLKKKTGYYEPGKRPDSNLKAKQVDFADVIIIGFEEPTKEYYGKEAETWPYHIIYKLQTINNQQEWIESERTDRGYMAYRSPNFKTVAVTKPYYMGWHNSRIKIGAINHNGEVEEIGTIHSGISDEMKKDMSEHPENYLGAVCSIQMMEVDKKEHTIRHGFFKHLREDKPGTDCLISDIF